MSITTTKNDIQHIGKIRIANSGPHGTIVNYFLVNNNFIEVLYVVGLTKTANSWGVYGWRVEEHDDKWSINRESLGYHLIRTKELMRELGMGRDEKYVMDINTEMEYDRFIQLFIDLIHKPMAYRKAFDIAATMVKL